MGDSPIPEGQKQLFAVAFNHYSIAGEITTTNRFEVAVVARNCTLLFSLVGTLAVSLKQYLCMFTSTITTSTSPIYPSLPCLP